MGTHIRETQGANGDLLAIHYFCSGGCYRDSFSEDRMGPATATGDLSAGLTKGGASPCAESEAGSETDVYCAECGVLMTSPNKEAPVVVNLIHRPAISDATGEADPTDARDIYGAQLYPYPERHHGHYTLWGTYFCDTCESPYCENA